MTTQELLDAKAAYHRLVTGQSAREFQDSNGERVAYNAANADRLLAYIRTEDPTYLVVGDLRQRISPPFGFVF